MISKPLSLARRYSLLSPAMMYAGMLLACFAWLMHITPLLTPLWDDNASLGHGICIELAPIVSTSHYHHSSTPHDPSMSSTIHAATATSVHTSALTAHNALDTADITSNTPALDLTNQPLNPDHDSKQHNSCDICTAMSAVITPTIVTKIDLTSVAVLTIGAKSWSSAKTYQLSRFLRPFLRAPPFILIA